MDTKIMKLSELKLNDRNPRSIKDYKLNKLVKSIKEFPEMLHLRELIVDEDMVILGGNMRYRAMKELGIKECPVKIAKGLSEEQKREFIIKDNISFGEWDFDILANEWDDALLKDWGMDLPSFDIDMPEDQPMFSYDKEESEEREEFEEPEYEPPPIIETDVKRGDLVTFVKDGDVLHRFVCGDSTSIDDVKKLMAGEKAEILFTSPPYSDMRTYNGDKDISLDKLTQFIPCFIPYANYLVVNLGIQRKDSEINQYWDYYIKIAKDNGCKLLSWNVWDKMDICGSIGNQTAMFGIAHEWIFVFGEVAKRLNRTIDNNVAENQKRGRYFDKTDDGKYIKRTRDADGGFHNTQTHFHDKHQLYTITRCKPQLARDEHTTKHPAVFPVKLPYEYISAMTDGSDIVADPFLGSGSTMVAAHLTGRRCYGMELDEGYCQVIINRMKDTDNDLSIYINGSLYK